MLIFCAAPPIYIFMVYWAWSVSAARQAVHKWPIIFCALSPAIAFCFLVCANDAFPQTSVASAALALFCFTSTFCVVAVVWAYVDKRATDSDRHGFPVLLIDQSQSDEEQE